MTTTSKLNIDPDFYSSKEECLKASREYIQTNPRYKNFTQKIFHAGDEEQFEQYRDATNDAICIPQISLTGNLFIEHPFREWEKYSNLNADAVINTFRYIFHKFKKGIFVKIAGNKLRVFLPFSKAHFINEWSDKIKVNKDKYGTMNDFLRRISEAEGRRFNPRYVNNNIDEWYGNNCLVRYEEPISEGESNVGNVKNMLEELCESREVPDIEFFINRRDFPILTRDGTEPYNNIWGTENLPLISHAYDQYVPILSMSNTDRYADMLIPTWEDWARVQSYEGKWFPRTCREYNENFDIPWAEKQPTAVFRGGTTGCGVTIDTNPRLKISYLSSVTAPDENGVPYLNAGITNWNLRPRKIQNERYLKTIEINKLPFGLISRLSPKEQSRYKYIVNVDGHVTAFRLSIELSMGSVILLVNSPWKIWYSDLLVPFKHYVPVKEDLSDLIDQIKWCREHDAECEQIAKNALDFFNTYLQKKGILDYMQKILVDLKDEIGVYLYNNRSPLDLMIEEEYKTLDFSFPKTFKNITDINVIPRVGRSYGLLQGLEWIIRKIIVEGEFENIAKETSDIFQNKLGRVRNFDLAGFSFAVKTTNDSQKIREHIHETYVGTKQINQLCKLIPNFAYVFGLYRKNDTFNVITERIYGETLHQYINSKKFSFNEFLFIVMQLCLSIQVAQNICGLVHYDLTPWNIVLQKLDRPMYFDYIIAYNTVIRIKTSVIPVIIDYGKSHVINNEIHHGFINMFKVSTIQDIITLLVTSIDQIINFQMLPQKDFQNLLYLANFLSGNQYRRNTFDNARSLRDFVRKARKYSALISDSKYELEKLEPYDLVKYIMKMRKDYKFFLGVVNEYRSHMDKGNGCQVFEYILSSTVSERLETYKNVFIRFKHCTIPQPKNLFFVYYAVQSLENNLISVRDNMLFFLESEGIDITPYEQIFVETMRFLHKVYQSKIDIMEEQDIIYELSGEFDKLIPAPYTDHSFLLPNKVKKLLSSVNNYTDFSDYKEIIEMILLNKGSYQLRDKDRIYYLNNFDKLLNTSSIIMKNNTANHKTLDILSKKIYTEDKIALEAKIAKTNNCENANRYLKLYNYFTDNKSNINIPIKNDKPVCQNIKGLKWTGMSCYLDSALLAFFATPTNFTNTLINMNLDENPLPPSVTGLRICGVTAQEDLANRKMVQIQLRNIAQSIRGEGPFIEYCSDLRQTLKACPDPENYYANKIADSGEFLTYILNMFPLNIAQKKTITYATNYINQGEIPSKYLVKTSEEYDCNASIMHFVPNDVLEYSPDNVNISYFLKIYSDSGELTDENLFKPYGDKGQIFKRRISISNIEYTPYLIFNIKRVGIKIVPSKNNNYRMRQVFLQKPIIPESEIILDNGQRFILTSIVIYTGNAHYVAIINCDNSWYYFDDAPGNNNYKLEKIGTYSDVLNQVPYNPNTNGTQYYYTPIGNVPPPPVCR